MHICLHLAVEDQLSELMLRRVVARRSGLQIGLVFSRGGYGYLRMRACAFNQAAEHIPFLLLTDLDKGRCAPKLVREWLGDRPRHPHFLLRVAVPEVESWLLADSEGLQRFLGLRGTRDFSEPEGLADAKAQLLALAERASPRHLREGLVRRDKHGQRHQGPNYNGALGHFVQDRWDFQRAASRCPSLARLIRAVGRLEHEYRPASPRAI
jgi:hypothetical protein